MPEFKGYVRRIDLEPKQEFLGPRTYAHVFLKETPPGTRELDVYTEGPRFESALLAAYARSQTRRTEVAVYYDEIAQGVRMITRVILDTEFESDAP